MNIRLPRLTARSVPRALAATVAALLLPNLASAANKTWDGGGTDSNWLTGGNWDLDTAPGLNDALFFAGIAHPLPVNDFASGSLFNGITFNTGTGAFNLTGNALTLTPGIAAANGTTTGGNITNSSVNAETVSLAITLGAGNHAISTTASGQLNLAGPITRSLGAQVVFTRNTGNINLNGSGFGLDASGILGGWAVTGIGNNTGDWATLDGAGNVVAFTAYTPVAPATTISTGATQNIKISTNGGNITMAAAGTTDINTLLYSGTAGNQTVDIGTGNTLRLGAKGGIMNTAGSTGSANRQLIIGATSGQGTLTAGGGPGQGGEIFLYNNSFAGTNNDLTINAVVADNGAGNPVTVNVMGYIVLNAANTYTGGTFINQGRIQASNAGAFGTGTVTVAPGAQVFLNANGPWTNAFIISGIGSTESNGVGAIRTNNGRTISGPITLATTATITSNGGTNNGASNITGSITGPGGLTIGGGSANTGSGRLQFGNGSGTQVYDYQGDTTINGATFTSTTTAASNTLFINSGSNNLLPSGPNRGNFILIGNTGNAGILDLNGTTQSINGLTSTGTAVANTTLNSTNPGTLTIGNNNAGGTYGGGIAGALAIVKTGTGTQTLTGMNYSSGGITVNQGTLIINGATSVNAASTTGTTAAANRSDVTVASAVGLVVGQPVSGAGIPANTFILAITGNTVNLTNVVPAIISNATLNFAAGSPTGSGPVLINPTATLSGTGVLGNVTLAANAGSDIAHLAPGPSSAVGAIGAMTMNNLTVNGGDYAVDIGGGNDVVNVQGTANFSGASTISPSSAAPNGIYTVLTAGTLNLTVPPTIISPTDTRKTFTADYSVANTISIIVDGLSKSLTWTGSLSGAWDLNQTANWNDGVASDKYFNGDTVNLADGPTNRTLTITTATLTPAAVAVNNSTGNDYAISGTGSIGGGATVTKDGTGTLILATNNTYSGGTSIFTGTIQVGNGGTSGSLGTGPVTDHGTLAFNRSDSFTVANTISGLGSLTKTGNGVLTLSGTNAYSGTTTISNGTIRATNTNSLGNVPGAGVTIAAGATLDLFGNGTANALNFGQKVFTVSGTGAGGGGAIINTGSVNQQNALQRVVLAADASFGGGVRFDIRAAQAGGVNQASLDLAGHTLTKEGTFFLSLVGVDVSDGDIIVNGGTLNLEASTTLPDFGTGKKVVYNAGTSAQFFATSTPSTLLRPMLFNGPGILIGNSSAGTSSVGSPMTLNADVTFTNLSATPGALTVAGNITEIGGARGITKTGNCIVILTGNNSFSGGTTITQGTLQMGSATALGAATAPLTVSGGTLDLGGNNLTVGSLAGTGGTITNNTAGAMLTLTVSGTANTSYSGVIQNGAAISVGLTKQGNGVLTLTGTSSYTGATTVSGGTLVMNGSLSGSSVTVSGGTLKGTGSILAGVELNSGTIAPGNSPGILTVGSTNLNGGTLAIEMAGNTPGNTASSYDQLAVTGFLALTAPVALTLDFSTYNPVDNVDAFTIVSNDGFGDITLLGDNARFFYNGMRLDEGTLFTATSGAFTQTFSISYIGGTGNDVVLSAVPEPGTIATLLGGLAVLAARRPRRSGRKDLDASVPAKDCPGRELLV